jgi:hypothetical protein
VASFTGISGKFQPESVAGYDRNWWQVQTGISGRFQPEYALAGGESCRRELLIAEKDARAHQELALRHAICIVQA